jgi:ribosomal protein L29
MDKIRQMPSNDEKKAVDEVKNDYLQSRRQENIDEGKNSGNQR